MLERLISLSKDVSAEGRRELLHAVTDLFLVERDPSEALQEHYAGIATQSLSTMAEPDRAAYAERVAPEAKLPRSVATTLANDPAATVASVVLRLSPVLTDADLAAVAVSHSAAHLLAIAERPTLSETVTDILVNRGDQGVLRTVSGNEGARLSERGVSGLLERSQGDERVVENLLRRKHQFTEEQSARVQRIAGRVGAGSASLGAEPFSPERRQAQERRLEVKVLIAEIRKGLREAAPTIGALAEEDRAFDLAQVISALADIPNVQCLKVLLDPDVTGIAVACRAVGLDVATFGAVLRLRASRLGQSPRQVEREAAAYAELDAELAERTMRFLQVRMKVS